MKGKVWLVSVRRDGSYKHDELAKAEVVRCASDPDFVAYLVVGADDEHRTSKAALLRVVDELVLAGLVAPTSRNRPAKG